MAWVAIPLSRAGWAFARSDGPIGHDLTANAGLAVVVDPWGLAVGLPVVVTVVRGLAGRDHAALRLGAQAGHGGAPVATALGRLVNTTPMRPAAWGAVAALPLLVGGTVAVAKRVRVSVWHATVAVFALGTLIAAPMFTGQGRLLASVDRFWLLDVAAPLGLAGTLSRRARWWRSLGPVHGPSTAPCCSRTATSGTSPRRR